MFEDKPPLHKRSMHATNQSNQPKKTALQKFISLQQLIERLIAQGVLPTRYADKASVVLGVYPSPARWRAFFDIALLIIGVVALVLALVFFVAYNWFHMGKMGKFALVEGALAVTVLAYVVLALRRQQYFLQQLLLLVASIIVGSLLALFGQVYQTGADTWQLFANWALLIIPFVLIARLPALWLLWLGLINLGLRQYLSLDINGMFGNVLDTLVFGLQYDEFVMFLLLAGVNVLALNAWLMWDKSDDKIQLTPIKTTNVKTTPINTTPINTTHIKTQHHWSTYMVALFATYYITWLGVTAVFEHYNIFVSLVTLMIWGAWAGFMFIRFRKYRIDVLMLTFLCVSAILMMMVWVGDVLLRAETLGFLLMGLLVIGSSSAAVVWLRHLYEVSQSRPVYHSDQERLGAGIDEGADHAK